jgi:hypothetical protein
MTGKRSRTRSNRSPLSAAIQGCGRTAGDLGFTISLEIRYARISEPYGLAPPCLESAAMRTHHSLEDAGRSRRQPSLAATCEGGGGRLNLPVRNPGRLAVLVGVAVIVIGVLVFFNPLFAVLAIFAFAAGLIARPTLRARWQLVGWMRRHVKAVVIGIAMAAVFGVALVVALLVIFPFKVGLGGGIAPVSAWSIHYRAVVRYAKRTFAVREQYLVDRSVLADAATVLHPSPRRSLMPPSRQRRGSSPNLLSPRSVTPADVQVFRRLFRRQGWRFVSTQDRSFVFERHRQPSHQAVSAWPLRTTLKFPILRVNLEQGLFFAPDDSSSVTLIAPSAVVHRTVPGAGGESIGDHLEQFQISLDAHGGFAIERLTIEANSPLARNPLVAKLLTFTLWTPLQVAVSLLFLVLGDAAKDRLKRVLGIGDKSAAQNAGDVSRGKQARTKDRRRPPRTRRRAARPRR